MQSMKTEAFMQLFKSILDGNTLPIERYDDISVWQWETHKFVIAVDGKKGRGRKWYGPMKIHEVGEKLKLIKEKHE